jgi:hypothetical protein
MTFPPPHPPGARIAWYKTSLSVELESDLLPAGWPADANRDALSLLLRERFARLLRPHISDTAAAVFVSRSGGATAENVRQLGDLSAGRECELKLLGELVVGLPRVVREWLRTTPLGYNELRDLRRNSPTPQHFTIAVLRAMDSR